MFFVLNSRYHLCGWEKLPFAILDRNSGDVTFLPREVFMLLYRCDGKHDLRLSGLSEREARMLRRLTDQGTVIPGEHRNTDAEQSYREYPTRFKESVQWSITGKCNANCRHCLISANENTFREPDTAACMEIVRQLGMCGIHKVSLTGGEPLVRPDFFELIDALSEQDITVTTIYTNGFLVSREFLNELAERGMRPLFQLSYDGKGKHDWLRGVPGAEEAVLRAFAVCREYGFPTSAAMCLHRENTDCLRESVRQLASLGCTGLKVSGLRAQGNAKRIRDMIFSQDELFSKCVEYLPDFFEDGAPMDLMLDGLFAWKSSERQCFIPFEQNCMSKQDDYLLCKHVRRSLYISPDGQVLPCMSMAGTAAAEGFPNLFQTPLRDILSHSEYMKRCDLRLSDYLIHNPDCADCAARLSCCGGCRALALGDNGLDYLARDYWACGYFRNGWREKLHLCLEQLDIPVMQAI